MVNATLVTVHGFWSNPATWDRLCAVWRADDELEGLEIQGFGYPSPRKPRLPFSWTRVPDFADIAQMLATEYTTSLGRSSSIAFVTHSQGGLILQRFLAWMINEGRAQELARVRTIVMLACPNGGSQYLASVRHALGYGRHPQAADLEILSKQVADTQRAVLARIVHASGVDDHHCRIPFHVYAAGSDAIVSAASAQAAFPGAGTLAGNHFTILDPAAPGNRTADVIKAHILTDLGKRPPRPSNGPGPAVPARPAEHDRPAVTISGTQGVQVGDHNVQYNVFSPPSLAGSMPQAFPKPPSSAAGSGQHPAGQPLVVEVSEATYRMEVIRRSLTLPVLVEMWAESSGPCRELHRVLERLATDSAGTWVLARVDADANPGLRASLEARRIPMVAAMIRGQVVDGFSGILSETELRQWIGRVLQTARQLGL
jgi:pimeloyl-ACP methyl ester carboxylesterase